MALDSDSHSVKAVYRLWLPAISMLYFTVFDTYGIDACKHIYIGLLLQCCRYSGAIVY